MSYPDWEIVRNSIFTRTRYFPMIDGEMPTFMGVPLATTPDDLEGADVVIIGAPYVAGWGDICRRRQERVDRAARSACASSRSATPRATSRTSTSTSSST